jgi:phosphatidylserine decarboxylase
VNFAREGIPFILIALAIAALGYTAALLRRSWPLWLLAFVLTILVLWVAYFFRDPERSGPRGQALVISPADGRVIDITEVDEPAFIQGRAVRISVFMNVFNVHVNRYPVSGRVAYVHYNQGRFLNAAAEKASLENEQMSIGVQTLKHRVLFRQIAGLVARRIITYSRIGARVDVFVPVGSTIRVKLGDRPQAGVTVLAEMPE